MSISEKESKLKELQRLYDKLRGERERERKQTIQHLGDFKRKGNSLLSGFDSILGSTTRKSYSVEEEVEGEEVFEEETSGTQNYGQQQKNQELRKKQEELKKKQQDIQKKKQLMERKRQMMEQKRKEREETARKRKEEFERKKRERMESAKLKKEQAESARKQREEEDRKKREEAARKERERQALHQEQLRQQELARQQQLQRQRKEEEERRAAALVEQQRQQELARQQQLQQEQERNAALARQQEQQRQQQLQKQEQERKAALQRQQQEQQRLQQLQQQQQQLQRQKQEEERVRRAKMEEQKRLKQRLATNVISSAIPAVMSVQDRRRTVSLASSRVSPPFSGGRGRARPVGRVAGRLRFQAQTVSPGAQQQQQQQPVQQPVQQPQYRQPVQQQRRGVDSRFGNIRKQNVSRMSIAVGQLRSQKNVPTSIQRIRGVQQQLRQMDQQQSAPKQKSPMGGQQQFQQQQQQEEETEGEFEDDESVAMLYRFFDMEEDNYEDRDAIDIKTMDRVIGSFAPSINFGLNTIHSGSYGQYVSKIGKKRDLDRTIQSRRIKEEVKKELSDLSPHKTDNQYVSPRFNVQKFNPQTRISFLKKDRLWEVNFVEKMFYNLKRKDLSVKSQNPFSELTGVDMDMSRFGEYVLVVKFRSNKKPRRLLCESMVQMWRLYELCKFAISESVLYVPEILSTPRTSSIGKGLKRIMLTGNVNLQKNVDGKMCVETKSLDGISFIAGDRTEQTLVYCVTWNLNKGELPWERSLKKFTLRKIFKPGADLYVISLQGMKPQKVKKKKKELLSSSFYGNYFAEFFEMEFGEGKYILSNANEGTMGCGIFLFSSVKASRRITRICWSNYPKSSGGSCMVVVTYNMSNLGFISMDLPNNYDHKKRVLSKIFSDYTISGGDINPASKVDVNMLHHLFVLGNTNYKIALSPSVAKTYAKKYRDLLQFDEFYQHRRDTGILDGFKEGEIKFPPSEPVCQSTKSLKWKYCEQGYLAYSSRILVRSLPGMDSQVLNYQACHSLHNVSLSVPVCSVINIATQTPHISHFAPPSKDRVIVFHGIYIGGRQIEKVIKSPLLTFEAEWIDKSPYNVNSQKTFLTSDDKKTVCSRKMRRYEPTANPHIEKKDLPFIFPVKSMDEFLCMLHLKICLRDESSSSGKFKGVAILPLKDVLVLTGEKSSTTTITTNEEGGNLFTIPLRKSTTLMGYMMGVVEIKGRDEVNQL